MESREQIVATAKAVKAAGATGLRGGAYKPRTSPYSFQGMKERGLELLAEARAETGLAIVTEVVASEDVPLLARYADVLQIGARNMQNYRLLEAVGRTQVPVLLKRGFGSTLQEFVQAAEFLLSGGNSRVVLCERGIRTFETKTRFTLDLCGVAYLKQHTNLPVILDPSHAMGYAYGVSSLARACVAMGIDGLLIEAHPNPKVAKSDASQQLNYDEFRALHTDLQKVAQSVGYQIV